MSKGIIAVIILILIIGGGIGAIWYFYEKPIQEGGGYNINLSIYSVVEEEQVSVDYDIMINGSYFGSGKTLKNGMVLEKVPANTTIKITSKNDSYYYASKELFFIEDNNYRAKLNLVQPTSLEVEVLKLTKDEIDLSLDTERLFKNMLFCIEWSQHIVYVKSNNGTIIDNPTGYEKYDKCYNSGLSINETTKLDLYYKIWEQIEEKDYINMVFIDSEGEKTQEEGVDLFAKDKVVNININNI